MNSMCIFDIRLCALESLRWCLSKFKLIGEFWEWEWEWEWDAYQQNSPVSYLKLRINKFLNVFFHDVSLSSNDGLAGPEPLVSMSDFKRSRGCKVTL